MSIASMLDGLAKEIFDNPEERDRFDEASNHPYECECELCKDYWIKMGGKDEKD